MALRLLFGAARNWRNYVNSNVQAKQFVRPGNFASNFLETAPSPIVESLRSIGFLNKTTGAELWKAVTSVSNAGKKRGRGKMAGRGMTKDLNQGQVIGQGKKRLILPGLNTPVKRGHEVVRAERGVDDPSWSEKLFNIRDMNRKRKRVKISHMERGYSGSRLAGRSVGAPDPIGSHTYDGFDARCIELKIVNVMRGNLGRYRRHSAFIVTGNGQGMCGFAYGKSTDPKIAIRNAKNRAAQKLMSFQICDGRTVHHDFFTQFGYTKIYGYKMPEGYGLQTHRVIKTLCQLIGIKDLRTKCEGSTNPQSIVKAFLLGLLQQKTYDQIAEEKKLYVVEFDERRGFFPRIVGVPSYCRTDNEIPKDENRDFKQYVFGGKVPLKRPPRKNPAVNLPGYQKHLKRTEKFRAWPAQKLYLRQRYGRLKSFLTDKYPVDGSNNTDKY